MSRQAAAEGATRTECHLGFRWVIGLQAKRSPMKGLTISLPFASLIASGEKFVENRSWRTNYRGPLVIHAGQGTQYLTRSELTEYPTSCAIAVANLVSCVSLDEVVQKDLSRRDRKKLVPGTHRFRPEVRRHKHTEGPWCWILEDVRQIEPLPMASAQGLWGIFGPWAEAIGLMLENAEC